MEVSFNYQYDSAGVLRTEDRYAVTSLTEYRLGGLDYAVLTLDGSPGANWPVARVTASHFAPGDEVTLVQHPRGLPKVVHSGTVVSTSTNGVSYADADTDGGSSGAGVLDWQGRVMAVHTNAGCHAGGGANWAVRVDRIAAVSPIVSSLIREYGPYDDATAWGDFNGDGYMDVAIGVPSYSSGIPNAAGAVRVIYSNAAGPNVATEEYIRQDLAGMLGLSEAGDFFGATVAVGDFNGDGYDDLAVGVPGEDIDNGVDQGSIHVVYGSAGGLSASGDQLWYQGSGGAPGDLEDNDHFGAALTAGDFNGDGRDDLAIGIPDESVASQTSAGAVAILYGTGSGIAASGGQLWQQNAIAGLAEVGDRFGAALASGDFDGDGNDDLAIGIPGEAIGAIGQAGAVAVLYSNGTVLSATGNDLWEQTPLSDSVEAGDRFGASLTTGDVDGDGYGDLVIGVPGEDIGGMVNTGAMYVLYGAGTGLGVSGHTFIHQDSAGVPGMAEPEDRFGIALATGYIDGDSYADVLVGASGEAVGSTSEAGTVWVFSGASAGLSVSGSMYFNQDTGTVVGDAEAGDRFASTLHCGDSDGDGYDDVLIGVPGEDWLVTPISGPAGVLFGSVAGLTDSGNLFLF